MVPFIYTLLFPLANAKFQLLFTVLFQINTISVADSVAVVLPHVGQVPQYNCVYAVERG